MAIDTSRIDLQLASGRSGVTAPFHHTTQRKRHKSEEAPPSDASAGPGVAAQFIVDVPLAAAAPIAAAAPRQASAFRGRRSATRPPWLASIAATLVVAATVWWIMSQRLPDIDPREVVQRNLVDARQAMAEGRYTDPAQRSALHYYGTVLALDPSNADAIAGIDAIADRHITDARVLLADERIAEAGVALEKARRVRPDHIALAVLDTQLRIELRKMLAASTAAIPRATAESPTKTPVAKRTADASSAPGSAAIPKSSQTAQPRETAPAAPIAAAPNKTANEAPKPLTITLDEPALARIALAKAAQAATAPSTGAGISASHDSSPGAGASIDGSSVATAATSSQPQRAPAPAVRSAAPKLIKMVQPEYPQEALIRGIEGWVDISLQVTAAGDVIAPRVAETSRGRLFNRVALAAVQQWKYEPRGDDAPTEEVRVRLRFQQSN